MEIGVRVANDKERTAYRVTLQCAAVSFTLTRDWSDCCRSSVRDRPRCCTATKMEQRSASEIIREFQPLLRKFEGDDDIVIVDAAEEPGTKLGDNYLSTVVRTKIVGKHGNGTPYKKNFMMKCLPRNQKVLELLRIDDLFFNESHSYKKVLPALGPFGPPCIYAENNKIIMEDMRDHGYATCERRNFLDLDHSLFALQTLSALHAGSLALKIKDYTSFEELLQPMKNTLFPDDSRSSIGKSLESMIPVLIKHIASTEPQTEELKEAVAHLNSLKGTFYEDTKQLFNSSDQTYYVLCHGDSWTNNLLFKHDSEGKILNLKIVDYQEMRRGSPASDFHYFVYSSTRMSVIEEKYEDLVKAYYDSLTDNLRKLNVPQREYENLTLEWFKDELNKHAFFGLVIGFCLAHAQLAEEDTTIDLSKVTKEQVMDFQKLDLPTQPITVKRMTDLTLHYMRTYVKK